MPTKPFIFTSAKQKVLLILASLLPLAQVSANTNDVGQVPSGYEQPSAHSPIYNSVIKLIEPGSRGLNDKEGQVHRYIITGLDVTIDPSEPLWKSISDGLSSKVTVEATKITLKGRNHWPSANVILIANQLHIEADGSLDLTPLNRKQVPEKDFGKNGEDGFGGSTLEFSLGEVTLSGDPHRTIFFVNGGMGQTPGPGSSNLNGSKIEPMAADLLQFESSADRERHTGHLIGVEEFEKKGSKWCSAGSAKWKCGSYHHRSSALGILEWPTNGQDATPAGIPGAGGAGGKAIGSVSVASTPIEQLISVERGPQGEKQKDVLGGEAGSPAFSIIFRCRNKGTSKAHWEEESHQSIPGKPAIAPTKPNHQNELGTIVIKNGQREVPHSSTYFEQNINYIRDLYLGEKYPEAFAEVEELQSTFKLVPLEMQNALLGSRIDQIKTNLLLNKTYFGFSRMSVPFYSMDINVAALDKQVQSHLDQRLLVQTILHLQAQSDEQRAKLNQVIQTSTDLLQESMPRLSELGHKRSKLQSDLNNLVAQKGHYEHQSEQLIQNLTAKVKSAESFRRDFERNKAVFTASMVAVGQFIGGSGGAAIVAGISEVPLKGSTDDQIKWLSNMKALLDSARQQTSTPLNDLLKQINETDFQELFSKEELKNYVESLKLQFENLSFQEKLELIQKFKRQKSRVSEDLGKLARFLEGEAESEELILKKVAAIAANDPSLKLLVTKASENQQWLNTITLQISDYLNQALELEQSIANATDLIILSKKDLFENSKTSDVNFAALMAQLDRNSEDQLLMAYDKLYSALRYTLLSNDLKLPNVFVLKRSLDRMLTDQTVEKRNDLVTKFYKNSMDNIRSELFRTLNAKNTIRKGVINYQLKNSEVKELQMTGSILLNFDRAFYNDKGLGMSRMVISKIEILDPQYTEFRLNTPEDHGTYFFQLDLRPKGRLLDDQGKEWEFDYSTLGTLNRYIAKSRFDKRGIVHSQEPIVKDYYRNMITAILNTKDTTLAHSNLFTDHAGYTQARLSLSGGGSIQFPRLRRLTLQVEYIYFE